MASEPAEVEVEKDPRFWFDDGNVILAAQRTAFRVHKSIISQHSVVFRDIFTSPLPLYDGCPVVRVTDTGFDLRELLRVVYDGVR